MKRDRRSEDDFFDFFMVSFFLQVYGKNRGDSGEIGTRRTFWLYCWRQELFLSEDHVRHYHLQNRCHVKVLQVQKGQEHDVVTSSHPSEVCLVV